MANTLTRASVAARALFRPRVLFASPFSFTLTHLWIDSESCESEAYLHAPEGPSPSRNPASPATHPHFRRASMIFIPFFHSLSQYLLAYQFL